MRSRYFLTGSLLFGSFLAQFSGAQEPTGTTGPSFDVIAVRRYVAPPPIPGAVTTGKALKCDYLADRVVCHETLRGFIEEAYQIREMEIAGPKFLERDEFDLGATMPLGTGKDTARLMLRRALSDRFHLQFHYETRQLSVYALVPGKHGFKLQAAADSAHRDKDKITVPHSGGMRASTMIRAGYLYSTAMSLEILAENLSYQVDLPVINMTGLTGEYKIDLHWEPTEDSDFRSRPLSDPEFLRVLQGQLGLRLEKRSVSANVFVVDHIDSVPSEN